MVRRETQCLSQRLLLAILAAVFPCQLFAGPEGGVRVAEPAGLKWLKPALSVYSETYHLASPGISGMSTQASALWGSRTLFVTGTVGQDWMTEPGGSLDLQPYSYLYAAPGLGLNLWAPFWGAAAGSFGLRYQWCFLNRVGSDDQETDNTVPQDHRILATLGQLWHQGPQFNANHIWFSELYSEAIRSSLADGNTTAAGFVRGGYRWQVNAFLPETGEGLLSALAKNWFQDAFLEVFASADRSGAYYANLIEVRPTLRLSRHFASTGLSLAFMGGPVQPVYLWGEGAGQDADLQPPENRKDLSARFLLIFGLEAG